ncbi:MAG: magnesium transporter [SAR324 cluster bacterium]|nr:magnesium transporter [SAR324 cluster bacterium]
MNNDFKYHKFIKKLLKADKKELLRDLLKDLSTHEIVSAILQLKAQYQFDVLELLPKDKASEVLSQFQDHSPILQDLVAHINAEQLSSFIEEMPGDDAADFMSILDDAKAEEVLQNLPVADREEITTLLQYNEESAGGIMNPYVISVHKEQTVDQAIQSIRQYIQENDFETFYNVYVVDEYEHLIGMIGVTQLLLAERNLLVSDLMDPNIVAVDEDLDQEEVVRVAQEYNLVVVPVIDKHLRLVGRITIDDLVDVIYEEHQEDMAHVIGTGSEEVLENSVFRTVRDRLPWLLMSVGGGFISAMVMSFFANTVSVLPQVVYFLPLIAALGGNIGIQSSSIVVRGLATGEIHPSDLFSRLWKEIRVAVVNGLVCSALLAGMAFYLTGNVKLGLVNAGTLMMIVCVASTLGASIPMLMKRLNIDPALATGPFITTTNDVLGILIHLGVATQFAIYLLK